MSSVVFALCPKCKELKTITKHHIFPRRWFTEKENNTYLYLCRECHDDLEYLIATREKDKKLPKEEYVEIAIKFLEGD